MNRVSAGTPVGALLRASRVNYVLEGAELAHKLGGGGAPGGPTARAGIALVRNETGQDLDRFCVLGVTGIVIDPADSDEAAAEFKSHFAFRGGKPDSERDGPGRIAITQAPCESGALVAAVMSGLTVCRLELEDDDTYHTAGLIDDDADKLEPGGPLVVVWHEEGPGVKYAVVNLGAGDACPNTHEFTVDGNPTTGFHEYEYMITKAGTEYVNTVQVSHDQTSAGLRSKLFTAFPALASKDVAARGGPLPNVAIYVTFAARLKVAWPIVQTDVTLNNSAAVKVRSPNNHGG